MLDLYLLCVIGGMIDAEKVVCLAVKTHRSFVLIIYLLGPDDELERFK